MTAAAAAVNYYIGSLEFRNLSARHRPDFYSVEKEKKNTFYFDVGEK